MTWHIIKDITPLVGTVGTLYIAYLALSTWKKQLKGTDKYQLSKKILRQIYQVQDAITNVRNPMIYLSKNEIESGNRQLRVLTLDSKAIWGIVAENKIESILPFIREIKSAIWMHFWLKGAYSPISQVDTSSGRVQENDKIIYDLSDKNNKDDFAKELAGTVSNIEKYFQYKMKNS